MTSWRVPVCGTLVLLAAAASVNAQDATPPATNSDSTAIAVAPEAQPAEPTTPTAVTLPAGAAIPLRFLSTVSSGTHARGQQFDLEVTDNINVGNAVVIPAGSTATGEVIHVDRARGLGKAGELIVSARHVVVGERVIKLRSRLSMTGQDKSMQALWLVPWIRGKDLEVPIDTEVIARTVTDEKFDVPLAHSESQSP
ncbi:MAG: hypothetical protein R3E65_09085 [Steroidobacteraceae bacterium]